MHRLFFGADLATALKNVDFVQEGGREGEDLKTELFRAMDALLPASDHGVEFLGLANRPCARRMPASGAGHSRTSLQSAVRDPPGRSG